MRRNHVVLFRDCIAVTAIVLSLVSAAAQAQVLSSYTLCSVSNPPLCNKVAPLCQAPNADENRAFLQWAVAMHRAGATATGAAVHTVRPAAPPQRQVGLDEVRARKVACSY